MLPKKTTRKRGRPRKDSKTVSGSAAAESEVLAKKRKRGRPKKPDPKYMLRPDEAEHGYLLKAKKLLNEAAMTKTIYRIAKEYPELLSTIKAQQETIKELQQKEQDLDILCSRINSIVSYAQKHNEQR